MNERYIEQMNSPPKNLILCADDFALSNEISQGILNCVKKKRLSAVSVMTNMPHWPVLSQELLKHKEIIDIGIHLNLTEGLALTTPAFAKDKHLPSLGKLFTLCKLKRLNKTDVYNELNRQIDAFVDATGQHPQFLDGHQHIHQFPVIRDVVLQTINERFTDAKPYLRLTHPDSNIKVTPSKLKSNIIGLTGGFAFPKKVKENNISHNSSFSGLYHFNQTLPYQKRFKKFLEESKSGGLIMCHPGLLDNKDAISKARYLEYLYLMSNSFITDCQKKSVTLTPFQN